MNRDPVAFLKANPALAEQAGILSAAEQDFATRRMDWHAKQKARDAENLRLIGLLDESVRNRLILEMLNIDHEFLASCVNDIQSDIAGYIGEIIELSDEQIARDDANEKRAAMRRDDRLGLGS